MAKTYTAVELAARYGCTRRAVAWRAKRLGFPPVPHGHPYVFTAAQAKALGPMRRGRPPGSRTRQRASTGG